MEPRRYFGGPMDAGRYMPRHGGWDSNSAVESYKGAPDAELRTGDTYGGRNFLESGVSQDNAYSRGSLHRDPFIERDGFQMPPQPAVGMWPDARRKTLDEELAILRNAPRHDKGGGYFEGYNQVGGDFRESDKFPRQIDYYHNRGSNVHDHGNFLDTDGYRRADKFHDAKGYHNVDMFHEADGYCNTDKYQETEGYCNADKFQEAEGYRNSTKFQEAEGYRNSAKFQEAERYRGSTKFQEAEGYRSTAKYQEAEGYRSTAKFQESEGYRNADKFHEVDGFRDYGYERAGRFPIQERNIADDDDFDYRHKSHERSRSRDYEYLRHDETSSDYERGKRDRKRRRQREREQERGRSRERERSIDRDRYRERSRSYSHDDHRRRSISPYIHSRGRREYSDDESRSEIRYERSTKKRDHDVKGYNNDRSAVAPSATLVVRGLSQKTVDDDLYHALKDWGPLRHVRVIKEKSSGVSRGFAFIDFPSVDAAQKMMVDIGEKGVVVDGRCLFFEYSSKPTGGVGSGLVASTSSTQVSASSAPKGSAPIAAAAAVDWTCNVCGCVNFARRTSCFQCNEARTEDALPGDAATSNHTSSRKAGEAGPTYVLVVRGLDEYVNEEDLHYEFSKHAPIKDLRLVRDKFTHVSRGFAFIHFHSVEDATKALESSNGKALEKNGNVLRVAYAKSIHGPGANGSSSQASNLAAAAIEAATFAQQYDQVGWAPKEYNPDQENKRSQEGDGTSEGGTNLGPSTDAGIHPGFVWDEASGYYYDAASGFYYDHHRALYYDGNNSIWYTYNYETQQYEPYADQSGGAVSAGMKNTTVAAKAKIEKTSEASTKSKAVISAPPATIHEPAFPAAVQAAASAANASTRKEREKELRLASKGLLLAGKKRMSNNISVWKQRKQDTQAVVIAETPSLTKVSTASVSNEKREQEVVVSTVSTSSTTVPLQAKIGTKKLEGVIHTKEGGGVGATTSRIKNISGKLSGTIYGGKYSTPEALASLRQQAPPVPSDIGDLTGSGKGKEPLATTSTQQQKQQIASESISTSTPFKTDITALSGSSGSSAGGAGGRRRFMEAPQPGTYRDRAAERRSLYGS